MKNTLQWAVSTSLLEHKCCFINKWAARDSPFLKLVYIFIYVFLPFSLSPYLSFFFLFVLFIKLIVANYISCFFVLKDLRYFSTPQRVLWHKLFSISNNFGWHSIYLIQFHKSQIQCIIFDPESHKRCTDFFKWWLMTGQIFIRALSSCFRIHFRIIWKYR